MNYANRFKLYLNQTINLETQKAPDKYGNAAYSEPQQIPARKEGHTRLVRSANGETVTSTTTVWTLAQVLPLDKIDGEIVINTMQMVDKAGNIIGWEIYL